MSIIKAITGRPREHPVRVLLDPSSAVPVLSENVVKRLAIKTFHHPPGFHLQSFTGEGDASKQALYSDTMVLRHAEDHFTRLQFEVSKLDPECDVILPHWWLQEHQPAGFYDQDPRKIVFTSPTCREQCTSLTVLGKVGRIISSVTDDRSSIPERFRDLAPLVPHDISQRLPDHKPWDHTIDLVDGKIPPWGPIYSLSGKELKFLRA